MILFHVLAESHLTALLLVRSYHAFVNFADDNHLLMIAGKQHKHASGKITTLMRMLTKEGERR